MLTVLRIVCLVVAIVLFVLLAFTVFHGEAVTRAAYLGFAFFAGAFLIGALEGRVES